MSDPASACDILSLRSSVESAAIPKYEHPAGICRAWATSCQALELRIREPSGFWPGSTSSFPVEMIPILRLPGNPNPGIPYRGQNRKMGRLNKGTFIQYFPAIFYILGPVTYIFLTWFVSVVLLFRRKTFPCPQP